MYYNTNNNQYQPFAMINIRKPISEFSFLASNRPKKWHSNTDKALFANSPSYIYLAKIYTLLSYASISKARN
jgi:hypothetical protein